MLHHADIFAEQLVRTESLSNNKNRRIGIEPPLGVGHHCRNVRQEVQLPNVRRWTCERGLRVEGQGTVDEGDSRGLWHIEVSLNEVLPRSQLGLKPLKENAQIVEPSPLVAFGSPEHDHLNADCPANLALAL